MSRPKMKLMVISDIHGSVKTLQVALSTFEKNHSDYLIILGDFLGSFPRINNRNSTMEIADLLNKIKDKVLAISGNCDGYVANEVFHFPLVENLTMINGEKKFFFTHGHLYNENNLPDIESGDCLIHGHFHIPWIFEKNGVIIASPGSISMPRAGSPNAYMMIEDGKIDILSLENSLSILNKVKRGIQDD